MLGRFHEISLTTPDIRASVDFYESLGFTQAPTTDTWSHPYGVLTDGRLVIGLHQRQGPSPTLTFVCPGLVSRLEFFTRQHIELTVCRTGDEVFNEIGFSDPFGQAVSVLEARTYSPTNRNGTQPSVCGYFEALSMPARNFETAREFWEPLGFVATGEAEDPFPHLPLTSDHLDLAFHRPRMLDAPCLLFQDADMPARIEHLRALGLSLSDELPRGLDPKCNALLESPEGTLLLLVSE